MEAKAGQDARFKTRAIVFTQKLSNLFPDVDWNFIRVKCEEKCAQGIKIDRAGLDTLIDCIMKEGPNHLIEQPRREKELLIDIYEKYRYIADVFRDVEPKYVLDWMINTCTTFELSLANSEIFIRWFLENPEKVYPKIDTYIEAMQKSEKIIRLTTDFQVDEFLENFPDPFAYFEDEDRVCAEDPEVLLFLKVEFNRHLVKTITRLYTKHNFNASLVVKELDTLPPDMKKVRLWDREETKNIALLEEFAFIRHRNEIRNFMSESKERENNALKMLKEANSLLTCQCCFDEECLPNKCSACTKGHIFCFECITRGTEAVLADGEGRVKCFTNCDGEFLVAKLQHILPARRFSAYWKKEQIAELKAAGIEGLVSCPFCHFASIPPEEDKVFKCLNPTCMKKSCRMCKEQDHTPQTCEDVARIKNRSEDEKARLLLEEKMTEALVRTCYKCGKKFFKEDGCNKMNCTCGAMMCFMCGQPVKDYKHFNPQMGVRSDLCPLWTDNQRMNAQAVIKVAEDVKNLILKENPNIKINMDSLLPKLPAEAKAGPHLTVPNANQLPAHLEKIIQNARAR